MLVAGVALLLGFAPTASPGKWLAAAGVVGLYVLAISWVSALIGLLAGTPEAASGFTFLMLFLPHISSAFVPTDTLPGWLQGVAGHKPGHAGEPTPCASSWSAPPAASRGRRCCGGWA